MTQPLTLQGPNAFYAMPRGMTHEQADLWRRYPNGYNARVFATVYGGPRLWDYRKRILTMDVGPFFFMLSWRWAKEAAAIRWFVTFAMRRVGFRSFSGWL